MEVNKHYVAVCYKDYSICYSFIYIHLKYSIPTITQIPNVKFKKKIRTTFCNNLLKVIPHNYITDS